MNLYNRRLYRFPLNGALTSTTVQSFAIPGTTSALPGAAAGCPTADVIPFGLGQRNSTLYVGLVCNGQTNATSSDLRAYVYAFNPVAGTFGSAPVLEFPLTYAGRCASMGILEGHLFISGFCTRADFERHRI